MKKYSIVRLVFILFFAFCSFISPIQAQNSYEFGVVVPVEGIEITTTSPNLFGVYENDAQLKYEINEQGIFVHTLNIQAISKETVRETGKYFVRNEHIFGVTKDSIPCVLQDDNYYFGVRNTTQLTGSTSENKLISNGEGSYVLNFKSENGYTPALIEIKNNQLSISYFDYDSEGKLFKKVKEKQTVQANNLIVIILMPTLREWQKLSSKELFGTIKTFNKAIL